MVRHADQVFGGRAGEADLGRDQRVGAEADHRGSHRRGAQRARGHHRRAPQARVTMLLMASHRAGGL